MLNNMSTKINSSLKVTVKLKITFVHFTTAVYEIYKKHPICAYFVLIQPVTVLSAMLIQCRGSPKCRRYFAAGLVHGDIGIVERTSCAQECATLYGPNPWVIFW
jgi:hypothetical protein